MKLVKWGRGIYNCISGVILKYEMEKLFLFLFLFYVFEIVTLITTHIQNVEEKNNKQKQEMRYVIFILRYK
jgi:hypothetical protein